MYLSRNMKTCFSALVSWDYCFHFFLFIDEKIAIMIVFENQIDWYLLWSQLVENRTKIQQKDLKRFLSTVLGRYCCFFFLFVPTVLLVASLYRLAIPSRQVLSFQSIIIHRSSTPQSAIHHCSITLALIYFSQSHLTNQCRPISSIVSFSLHLSNNSFFHHPYYIFLYPYHIKHQI